MAMVINFYSEGFFRTRVRFLASLPNREDQLLTKLPGINFTRLVRFRTKNAKNKTNEKFSFSTEMEKLEKGKIFKENLFNEKLETEKVITFFAKNIFVNNQVKIGA